jgi:hypothetical protein
MPRVGLGCRLGSSISVRKSERVTAPSREPGFPPWPTLSHTRGDAWGLPYAGTLPAHRRLQLYSWPILRRRLVTDSHLAMLRRRASGCGWCATVTDPEAHPKPPEAHPKTPEDRPKPSVCFRLGDSGTPLALLLSRRATIGTAIGKAREPAISNPL